MLWFGNNVKLEVLRFRDQRLQNDNRPHNLPFFKEFYLLLIYIMRSQTFNTTQTSVSYVKLLFFPDLNY